MPDLDLGILEILIAFFLFMPAIRPFIKSLRRVEGFLWFPPAALCCLAGLFWVYGPRPECLPLFLYAAAVNIANLPAFLAFLSGLRSAGEGERRFAPFCLNIALLSLSAGAALFFLPVSGTALASEGVETFAPEYAGGRPLAVRVYGASAAPPNPVILAVPPAAGSVAVIDLVCGELAARGATVVSYSRKDADLPAYRPDGGVYPPSWAAPSRIRGALGGGLRSYAGNLPAREAETARAAEIAFLTDYIGRRWPDRPALLLGYGAGGAAAVYLAADEAFVAARPSLRGVIAVESYLYSAYDAEPPYARDAPDALLPFKALSRLEDRLARARPRRLRGPGEVPRPLIPVVFLLSGDSSGDGPYAAPLKTARLSPDRVTARRLRDATLFDLTDIPRKYPVLRALAAARRKNPPAPPADPAALFAAVAGGLLAAPPPP